MRYSPITASLRCLVCPTTAPRGWYLPSPRNMVFWCLAVQMRRVIPSMTWLLGSKSFSFGFLLRNITGDQGQTGPTLGCPHLDLNGSPCPSTLTDPCWATSQPCPPAGSPPPFLQRTLAPQPESTPEWAWLPFLFFSLVTTVMAMVLGGTSSPVLGMRLTWSERKLLLSVFLIPVSRLSPSFFLSSPCVVQ